MELVWSLLNNHLCFSMRSTADVDQFRCSYSSIFSKAIKTFSLISSIINCLIKAETQRVWSCSPYSGRKSKRICDCNIKCYEQVEFEVVWLLITKFRHTKQHRKQAIARKISLLTGLVLYSEEGIPWFQFFHQRLYVFVIQCKNREKSCNRHTLFCWKIMYQLSMSLTDN